MRLRKSMSRIARTFSCSSTYSRIDSSGSIEIDQRFSVHLDLVEADLGVVEHPRGVLLRGDLADDRPLACRGGAQPQRHRDRRLADATLAGHEDQSLVE